MAAYILYMLNVYCCYVIFKQDFHSSLYLIVVATSDLGHASFAFIKPHAFFLEME